MTLSIAPMFGLLPIGFRTLLGAVRWPRWRGLMRVALVGGLIWSAFLVAPLLAFRRPLGFRDAASFLETTLGLAGHRFMVVSDENGEGAFVTEIASRHPEPRGDGAPLVQDHGERHLGRPRLSSCGMTPRRR